MTTQLHDTGEEFIVDKVFTESVSATSVSVGLYNDSTDSLGDSSDVGDITTEPTGSNYAKQSASFGSNFTNTDSSGNWETQMDDLVFNTSDSNQSVDSYFVVINYDSQDTNDGGTSTDHLFFTGSLDQTYDLSSVDQFTLSDSGLSIN